MTLPHVVILAIVQGLTEFLPISSTAHLFLTSWLLGWEVEDLSFDISLHLGTLIAVLLYFFRDWVQIVLQAFGADWLPDRELAQNRGLFWLLVIASIPVGIAGLAFAKKAESAWRNPFVIGTMLIVVGLVMWAGERTGSKMRDLGSVNVADAGTIGAAQALAIVPGTSRSGITITAGLFRGLDRDAAARFSFLLSTPAIAAAAAKAMWDLHKQGGHVDLNFVVGVVVSAITGCLVIAWFLRYLKHGTLMFFIWYRIVFGIFVLAMAFFR